MLGESDDAELDTTPILHLRLLGGFELSMHVEGEDRRTFTPSRPSAEYALLAYLGANGGMARKPDMVQLLVKHSESDQKQERINQVTTGLRGKLAIFSDIGDRKAYIPEAELWITFSERWFVDAIAFDRLYKRIKRSMQKLDDHGVPKLQTMITKALALYQGDLLDRYDQFGVPAAKPSGVNWVIQRRAAMKMQRDELETILYQLNEQATTEQGESKGVQTLNFPDNLPLYEPGPFIGRVAELEQVTTAFHTNRVVKLVGTGGIGKTRLAVKAASNMRGQFDKIWLFEMANCKTKEELENYLSTVTGVKAEPNIAEMMQQVCRTIPQRSAMIVLDNCEHLVEESRLIVEQAVRSGIAVLLTTQFDTDYVAGKTVAVGPMSVPELDALPQASEISMRYASVDLFQRCAELCVEGFEVDEDNKLSIARICCALDGHPLAIHLVASQLRYCSLEDIERELTSLLLEPEAAGKGRHSTMMHCINWAYESLDSQHRVLLCRLSQFRAGWSRSGFEGVCGFAPLGNVNLRITLNDLVASSLVIYSTVTGRYRMLEPIRQFAEMRLEASGEKRVIESKIEDWIDEITADINTGILPYAPDANRGLEGIVDEIPNIDIIASRIEVQDPTKAGELGVKAMLARFTAGNLTDNTRNLQTVRRIAGKLPLNNGLQIWLYLGEAVMAFMRSDFAATVSAAEPGLALARQLNQLDRISVACCGLGIAHVFLGNVETAEAFVREAAETADRADSDFCRAVADMSYGAFYWQLGNLSDARKHYVLALGGFEGRGSNRVLASFVVNCIAHLNCRDGHTSDAARQYLIGVESRNARVAAGCVIGTCGLATATNCLRASALLYGAAIRMYETVGAKLVPPVQADYDREIGIVRIECGRDFDTLRTAGAGLSDGEAKAVAKAFLHAVLNNDTNNFIALLPEKAGLRNRIMQAINNQTP